MNCKICGGPVHPARLGMNSRVVTCSRECTRENNLRLMREGARRQRARQKEMRRKAKETK